MDINKLNVDEIRSMMSAHISRVSDSCTSNDEAILHERLQGMSVRQFIDMRAFMLKDALAYIVEPEFEDGRPPYEKALLRLVAYQLSHVTYKMVSDAIYRIEFVPENESERFVHMLTSCLLEAIQNLTHSPGMLWHFESSSPFVDDDLVSRL